MIKKFNHVGIAVRDLEKAIQFFKETYGADLVWRRKFEEQQIESAFVSIGDAQFELIGSLSSESVIAKFIEARGEGIHHVSLEVDAFENTIRDLRTSGLRIIAPKETGDFKAAFIHPENNQGVLTEIIEPKAGNSYQATQLRITRAEDGSKIHAK